MSHREYLKLACGVVVPLPNVKRKEAGAWTYTDASNAFYAGADIVFCVSINQMKVIKALNLKQAEEFYNGDPEVF